MCCCLFSDCCSKGRHSKPFFSCSVFLFGIVLQVKVEYGLNIIMLLFLIGELIIGCKTVKNLIASQTTKFYLEFSNNVPVNKWFICVEVLRRVSVGVNIFKISLNMFKNWQHHKFSFAHTSYLPASWLQKFTRLCVWMDLPLLKHNIIAAHAHHFTKMKTKKNNLLIFTISKSNKGAVSKTMAFTNISLCACEVLYTVWPSLL